MIPKGTITNTLVDYPRLNKLIDFVGETAGSEGHIAEVGVYKGGTALLLIANTIKKVFLLDAFEGLPAGREGAKLATDLFCKENNLTVIPTAQCQVIIRF